MPIRSLSQILADHSQALMALPGVVGIAESRREDGSPSITILVSEATPALLESLPKQIEGYPVIVEAGGIIRPLDGDQD